MTELLTLDMSTQWSRPWSVLSGVESTNIPPNVKRATMTNEVLRRLRNTRRDLPWPVFADTISEFSNDLRHMGYNEAFRGKVIQPALTGYKGLADMDMMWSTDATRS